VRTSVVILTTLLLAAGCASSPRVRSGSSPSPSESPSAAAMPRPVAAGTVHNDRTSFLVRVRSVKTARHFYVNGRMADDAPWGRELVVVQVVVTNVGRAPSHLEATDRRPLILVDTEGGTHPNDRPWDTGEDMPPGATIEEPFVFNAPRGKKPASVTVTLTCADGSLSTTSLAMPGRTSRPPASGSPAGTPA
jgi:hypothetical protein